MFIVRSTPRVGTHLMRTTLNSHPQLSCHGELFNVGLQRKEIAKRGTLGILNKHIATANTGFVVHDVVSRRYDRRIDQAYAQLWDMVTLFTPPLINLHRRDMVRQAVSRQVAAVRQEWNRLAHEGPRPEHPVVAAKWPALRDHIRMSQAALYRTQTIFTWGLTVYYEDLCRSWEHEINRVQRYLKVAAYPLEPGTVKLDTRSIEEIVTNWDSIRARLLTHGWEDLVAIAEDNSERAVINEQASLFLES